MISGAPPGLSSPGSPPFPEPLPQESWPRSQPNPQPLSGALDSLQVSHLIKRSPLFIVQNLCKQLPAGPARPQQPLSHLPHPGSSEPEKWQACNPQRHCSGSVLISRRARAWAWSWWPGVQPAWPQCRQLQPCTACPPADPKAELDSTPDPGLPRDVLRGQVGVDSKCLH